MTVRTLPVRLRGTREGPWNTRSGATWFLVIAVVRFGLVMGVETCGGGVTCERSAERRRHSGSTCLGIRREDDNDEDDEDDDEDNNVGMMRMIMLGWNFYCCCI